MTAKNEGRSSQLLLLSEAESWTGSVIAERAVELVKIATRGLTMSDSSTRMDCLRWLGEKLVTHIDVFELEELLLKPFLNSVLDYLEEIIKASEETTQQNTLLLTKIIINILQQSIKVSIYFLFSSCQV